MADIIRVVVADDQPLQRQGLRMVLDSQADIQVIGEASNGMQAFELVRHELTDVLLMDIQMPRVNGLAAAAQIAADGVVGSLGRPPRIILLTAVDVDDHVEAAAIANVYAVLFKDVAPEALLAAVRAAAAA